MYYVIYIDVDKQWRWTLYAANNRKIANAGEGYHNKADCRHAIALVATSGQALVHER
ncbi:YegP family protein [uncultured Enterovirga sp.]|uniref:YegP family protein n=1 Tax=uncultured Enterovirga sp. TaxID=2026352 RepID=UPI0035CA61E5